jgi:hypothetical protein
MASGVGTALRNDADRPDGVQPWFEVVAITFVPLLLCARRRWPLRQPTTIV